MLKIAYLSGEKKQLHERKPSQKEMIRREAIVTIAARRITDRQRAEKLFATEIKELEDLRRTRDELRKKVC